MPEQLKIGYLVPQFPGQTHIFFWREIAELERRGAVVSLFSTRPPAQGLIAHEWSDAAMARTTYLGQVRPLAALAALPAVPWGLIWRQKSRAETGLWRDILLCLPAAHALVRACKRQGIGHVHVHSCGRAALIAALAQRLGGPTYSLTLHGPLADYGPGQRFKWGGARFATVITDQLLKAVRQTLAPDLPDRLLVRPMGVDTETFRRDSPYRPHEPGLPLRLFSCGRLNMVKGHQDLMATVRLLLDQGVSVTLDIAGEDDDGGTGYRKDLEALIAKLDLGAHVRLLGAISEAQVRTHLLAAHIFVLASWSEPLGVALMEAMSCEVPTIGTAAGGVAELITDGKDGLLVPPRDPAALAETIVGLSRDPARATALGQAGRARVLAGFQAGLGAASLLQEIAAQ